MFSFAHIRPPTHPPHPQTELYRQVLSADVDFCADEWDDVSDLARDFVSTLLDRDQTRRPDIDAVLAHPWLAPKIKKTLSISTARANSKPPGNASSLAARPPTVVGGPANVGCSGGVSSGSVNSSGSVSSGGGGGGCSNGGSGEGVSWAAGEGGGGGVNDGDDNNNNTHNNAEEHVEDAADVATQWASSPTSKPLAGAQARMKTLQARSRFFGGFFFARPDDGATGATAVLCCAVAVHYLC